jgi:hypothetical protein
MDLQLSGAVSWLGGGPGVAFSGGRIGTGGPAAKVIEALRASGRSTFEVWALPASVRDTDVARLLTVAGSNYQVQNFMLAQVWSKYQLRLLHTAKDAKANPRLLTANGAAAVAVQHLVHTYDGAVERLYIDGVQQPETVALAGDYGNWDATELFSIGNMVGLDKPFIGEVYLVAVYNRALSGAEVQQNYQAGPSGAPPVNRAPLVEAGRTGRWCCRTGWCWPGR